MTTFDTPHPLAATVDLAVGAVHLRAAERDTTVVEVRPTDPRRPDDVAAAEQTSVTCADGRLVVRGPKRGGRTVMRAWLSRDWGGSIDVSIDLPASSSIEAKLGSADLQADGDLGDCRVRTGLGSVRLATTASVDVTSGAGDLAVERVTGRAELTTASGQVHLGEANGNAVVKNSNGTTRIDATTSHLRVRAANGDIEVGRARGDVVAKSANGSLRLDEMVEGTAVLETQVGDIEVGIPAGTTAWLDLDATAGSVRNELDTAPSPDTSDETAKVRARTTLGQILVRRPQGAHEA